MSAEYTLVLAVKDGAEFIQETLESVMAQTVIPSQIVLSIDHAIDNTVAIAKSVIPDLEVLYSEKHGMVAALNLGIGEARHKYLSFLDHDDLWEPTKAEMQIDLLNSKTEIDVVCSATRNFTLRTIEGLPESTHRDFGPARLFSASTFRTDCFERFGLPDESVGHFQWMYEWWSVATAKGVTCDYLPDIHLLRRVHGTNSWVTQQSEAHRQVIEMVRRHKNRST